MLPWLLLPSTVVYVISLPKRYIVQRDTGVPPQNNYTQIPCFWRSKTRCIAREIWLDLLRKYDRHARLCVLSSQTIVRTSVYTLSSRPSYRRILVFTCHISNSWKSTRYAKSMDRDFQLLDLIFVDLEFAFELVSHLYFVHTSLCDKEGKAHRRCEWLDGLSERAFKKEGLK